MTMAQVAYERWARLARGIGLIRLMDAAAIGHRPAAAQSHTGTDCSPEGAPGMPRPQAIAGRGGGAGAAGGAGKGVRGER